MCEPTTYMLHYFTIGTPGQLLCIVRYLVYRFPDFDVCSLYQVCVHLINSSCTFPCAMYISIVLFFKIVDLILV